MIILDKTLLSVALLLIVIIAFQYRRSIKEDSIFWYGKWRDFLFWERAKKSHEKNKDK